MKRLLRLSKLYIKTAFSCLGRALIILAAILAIAALLLWSAYRNADGGLSVAKIGMVSEDDSEDMKFLMKIARQMPVVKGLCSLQNCSMDEAMEELKSGDLQMVMAFPKNYVTDLEHMQDATLTLYVPKGNVLANTRIYSMLSSVESIMVTTECAICSMYEGMEYYTYNTTVAEMEDAVFKSYIQYCLNREDVIDIEYLSAYGNFDSFLYYGISIILFVTTLMGVFMLRGYSKNICETEKLLAVDVRGRIAVCLIKIICFCVPYAVFGGVSFTGFCHIANRLDYDIFVTLKSYLIIILISLTISAFVHLYASLIGTREGRETLYALIVTFVWILSGAMLGGNMYLPPSVSRFSLLAAATESRHAGPVGSQLLYLAGFTAICIYLSIWPLRFERSFTAGKIKRTKGNENANLYITWLKLKLKQNLTSYVFWLEAAILVLTVFTVHFLVLKNTDTNRVIYVSNNNNREIVEELSDIEYSGFDYETVSSLNEMKAEIIRGEAMAGIDSKKDRVILYAPTGSYSAVVLREMIFPYIYAKYSPKLLAEYLKGIGLKENDEAYTFVMDANRKLLKDFKVNIFKITEVDTAAASGVKKTDIVVITALIMILLAGLASCIYELKTHRGFLNSKTFFVRIALVFEGGIVRGLLLAGAAVIALLIIRI